MAVITGFLAHDTDSGYNRLYLTDDLDDYSPAWIGNLVPWAAIPGQGAPALTANYPVSTTPYAKSGNVARSYFDDYYNRIHVAPSVLDIGNLLSVQTRQSTVWNAYFTSTYLSSIFETNTDGITSSGIPAPRTFTPLEEAVFSLTVDTKGPATIDASYAFNFPSEIPILRVIGRRVVVFSYPPNWDQPVIERLSWLTDVMRAQAGTEQRVGLRAAPRRDLEYSIGTIDQRASNRLETLLIGWQARVFAVPVWTDRQTLAGGVGAGSTGITCDITGYEFTNGGLIVLWDGYDSFEALSVKLVGSGVLLLGSPVIDNWPSGTKLLPVRLGTLPSQQNLSRETRRHLSGKFTFSFIDNPATAPADTGDTYLGYKVYAGTTNWDGDVDLEFSRQLETLDYDTGARWVDDLSGLSSLLKPWNTTLNGRTSIVVYRSWLAARAGRRTPFWSITQGQDLEVTQDIGSAALSVIVRNIGYTRYIKGSIDRRHIIIKTISGVVYYRQLGLSSEVSTDEESLSIDTVIGVTLQPSDIKYVRFIHLTRLESDAVEIEWHHLGLAQSTILLRSIPA